MFVKVEHFNGAGEYTMYEVNREVTTGHFYSTEAPDVQQVLDFDHWDFSAEWWDQTPSGKYEIDGKVGGDCWELRYAWWADESGFIHAVITKGRIYLLSEAGKTIDRV